jgi:hypothetical protein
VIGNAPPPPDGWKPGFFQGLALVLGSNTYKMPTAGILVGYQSYCIDKYSTFDVLVWRPTDSSSSTFTLIDSTPLMTNVSFGLQTVRNT